MDKTRGYQASIDYLMPIAAHPVLTGEYSRHVRNSIDAMIKLDTIQSELERLNAENAKLRAVAEAARGMWWGVERSRWNVLEQALAELDEAD